ncbi:MAG: sigma-70 family RNA polymerase sigma factor [Syntrophobacterales bacterium]|nr:sigma-70 family RNA polymerase sigma factor [Syntrophobacterales bacterium]
MKNGEIGFQQIYTDYQEKIRRYLTRMVGENEAEDLTQEVFVKIGQSLETFRGESSLSTWIYRIATNTALDKLRHPYNHHAAEKLLPVEAVKETKEDENIWTGETAASTEQRVIRQEMNGCIREIIETLPETYRSVIVLSELEGLSDGEIADILNLTIPATKIRLHRARARLRKELSTACVFYRDERQEFACDRKVPRAD